MLERKFMLVNANLAQLSIFTIIRLALGCICLIHVMSCLIREGQKTLAHATRHSTRYRLAHS